MSKTANLALRLNEILEQLSILDKKINNIEKKIDGIISPLNTVVPACTRMNEHVTFVNGVYTTLKSPLEYISSAFSRSETSLPDIETSNNLLKDEENPFE